MNRLATFSFCLLLMGLASVDSLAGPRGGGGRMGGGWAAMSAPRGGGGGRTGFVGPRGGGRAGITNGVAGITRGGARNGGGMPHGISGVRGGDSHGSTSGHGISHSYRGGHGGNGGNVWNGHGGNGWHGHGGSGYWRNGRYCGYGGYGYGWPYFGSFALGLGYSSLYYGGYDGGYVASYGYPVYEEPPVEAVAPLEPPPPVEVPQWADEDLKELGLNKFCMARGLDRDGNRVVLDVISKSFHDETGALHKAKMQVRWTEWKTVKSKDGTEHQVEKIKNDKFKLKFDKWGRFTEFDD